MPTGGLLDQVIDEEIRNIVPIVCCRQPASVRSNASGPATQRSSTGLNHASRPNSGSGSARESDAGRNGGGRNHRSYQ